MSETAISQMADNVVLLHFVRRDGEYRRAMTFFKSRATGIPLRTWEYTISSNGIAMVQRDHARRRA